MSGRTRQVPPLSKPLAPGDEIHCAATVLTEETGEWTAANLQETIWAWSYALLNYAEAVDVSAVDLAKQNLDPLIAGVPDFQKLLAKDRELEAILGTVSVWRGVQYRTVLR